jgi:hypothetical protein
VELLRCVAEGVGLLRARGDRLEATSLRHAWGQIDQGLRAGLTFAAWCHRVPWPAFLHGGTGVETLVGGRLWVLRLLFGLPAGVEVGVPGLTATVAGGLGLDGGDWLDRAVAAAFLDPLVALGGATLDPPPHPAASLCLLARATTVIGSALVAAGEEVPLAATPAN